MARVNTLIALIAGLFGFGFVSAKSWFVAKVFFVLAVVAFVGGYFSRSRTA